MPNKDRLLAQKRSQLHEAGTAEGQKKLCFDSSVSIPDLQLDEVSDLISNRSTSDNEDLKDTDIVENNSINAQDDPVIGDDDVPNQQDVKTVEWIKKDEDFTQLLRDESKKNNRYFLRQWLTQFPWLQYHRAKRQAFCSTCSAHELGKQAPRSFIYIDESSVGFSSWNKGIERFEKHEISDYHRKCHQAGNLSEMEKLPELISDDERRKKKLRREGLKAHLETLRTLLRQGLAFRQQDDNEGNFHQFNKDKSEYIPGLKLLMNENRFMSHDMLEEQEKMIVLPARRELNEELRAAQFFVIIVDEATDISKIEHMSLSVRYCTDNYVVKEEFLGVFTCSDGVTTDALFSYMKDILLRCQLDTSKLVGMAFDGASSMKCLAKKIKAELNTSALFIHCLAHCQELVFKDATKHSEALDEAQTLCEDLYVLVGVSPKRVALFEQIQVELENPDVVRLQNLSRTRWTTRGSAASVVTTKYVDLVMTLDNIAADRTHDTKCKARARGLRNKLQSAKQMFNMFLLKDIAQILEMNSKHLQKNDLSAEEALDCIKKIEIRLNEMRTDDREFDKVR